MPSDKERYPGRFPVWMQLGFAKALRQPDEWVEVAEFWSDAGVKTETRSFRAFRRSVRNPEYLSWAESIRPDAGEFQSQVRVRKESVVVGNWPRVRRVIEIRCYKGPSRKDLQEDRADLLRKFAEDVGEGQSG
jgi:hypothetical protein